MTVTQEQKISVAVDCVVFSTRPFDDNPEEFELFTLLVTRKFDPFQGQLAIPGGFVNPDETLADAASRELREETGLDLVPVGQMHEKAKPGRDPRGRVISFPFVFLADDLPEVVGQDDALTAEWVRVNDLDIFEDDDFDPNSKNLPLAFDHASIMTEAVLPFQITNDAMTEAHALADARAKLNI